MTFLRGVGARLFLIASMLTLSSQANSSDADTALSVTLSLPASKDKAEAGIVIVTISNRSSTTRLLPKPLTPLQNPDGHLLNNIFSVTNAKGEKVEFTGRFVHVLPEPREQFYIRLAPGDTLSKEINLAADYNLRAGGLFHVRYTQSFHSLRSLENDDTPAVRVDSNELDIWINTSLVSMAVEHRAALGKSSLPLMLSGCDEEAGSLRPLRECPPSAPSKT
ncbi:hypothetical protein EC912_10656 [Luteibacter rhizovicinus]|uniref:Pili/flagellar assembly PapD-like chaperone n=2 Tax=Luteibacter rhizovicinus TaxID=242606 RepID=A0A4R3YMK0_9GAMM|nr:hypothetical protein EC912_10656 [Luteibacter rhizovicinus]